MFPSKNRQGNVNSFCIVQFSRSFFSHPFGRLVYYITSFRSCQVLFKTFLNFLFKPFKKWLPFRKAHLLYHISFRLSRGISKNFEIFRDFLSFRLCYRSFPGSLYIIAPFCGFVNLFYTFSRILSHLHIILNNLSTAHSIMHNSPRQISTFSQTTDSFLLNITHFSAEYYFFSRFYDIVIV